MQKWHCMSSTQDVAAGVQFNAIQQELYCSSNITVHLQRALGRWVRSSIDKGRKANAEQPASEEPAGRSAAPDDSVPVQSPFADLPSHEPFPGMQPASSSAAAPSNKDQPALVSSKGLHVGPRKGSQEEHSASASTQPQKADSGGRRSSQTVGQEHQSSAALHSRTSMMSSTQSTGGLLVTKVQEIDACMERGCLIGQRALPRACSYCSSPIIMADLLHSIAYSLNACHHRQHS